MPVQWFPIEIKHPITGEVLTGRGFYASPQSCPTERFQHVKALYARYRHDSARYKLEEVADPALAAVLSQDDAEALQLLIYDFSKRLIEICLVGIPFDLFMESVTEDELMEYCTKIQSGFTEVPQGKKAEPLPIVSENSLSPGCAAPGSDPELI